MNKNAYIVIMAVFVVFVGALYVSVLHSDVARAQIQAQQIQQVPGEMEGRQRGGPMGPMGRFGEDFKDLERGFSRIFDRLSNVPPAEVPMSMSVNPEGDVRLTSSEVTAISGTQITVRVWGWSFTVDSSNARIIGRVDVPAVTAEPPIAGAPITPGADINVGDRLLVKGKVDGTTGVIAASWIKNLSLRQRGVADIENRINQLLQLLQRIQEQLRALPGREN